MSGSAGLLEAAESLLDKLSKRFDEAAVKVGRVRSVMVKAARGSVSVVQSWVDEEVSIYVTRKSRIYVASAQPSAAEQLLEAAERIIERLEPSKLYAPLPEPSGESVSLVDPQVEKAVSGDSGRLAEPLGVGEGLDVSGMARAYVEEEALATSTGARLARTVSGFDGYVRVFKGGDISGQWSWVSTALDLPEARRALETAVRLADECSSLPREAPGEGVSRLLLSPMTAGELLEWAASAALAGSVIAGSSFLVKHKPGDRVASEKLTLASTPRDSELPEYTGFDDEGVKTRDVAFIESGVLKTLLHNTKTARALGAETTGNAGWIFPRLYNLYVAPGDVRDGEEVEALGEGVYVTNNWYTRFQNHVESTFSTVPRDAAFIVRGGRPRACIPGYKLRLEGALKSVLSGVEALGSRLYRIRWWEVETPIKVPFIVVSESAGVRVRRAG